MLLLYFVERRNMSIFSSIPKTTRHGAGLNFSIFIDPDMQLGIHTGQVLKKSHGYRDTMQ